jgi:8-oxo-dGTP pyrophosphatase MutT (NUDIX family)
MSIDALAVRLAAQLAAGAPGALLQQRLAPRIVGGGPIPRAPGSRRAAALLLVFARGGRPHVVLTRRAPHLPHHADQVSLPGGRIEPDESPERAALREAHEEIGVPPAIVRVVGLLTPVHIPVSGFTLHVVVGVATEAPVFLPDPGEVAAVIEVPIDVLADPGILKRSTWTREGRELDVPYFDVQGHYVWGATAMALGEFLALVGHDVDPWNDGGRT